MKLKIKELNANPFKKEINKGKLDEDTIKKIQNNIKELGLMGSLPIFKKDNKYYLVAGHHRVEALKRVFGKNYEIDVDLKNYNEDQILRGMIVENLTQRDNEHNEETSNILAIKKYLLENKMLLGKDGKFIHPTVGQMKSSREDGRGGKTDEYGSISQISLWLDKGSGDVMRKSKIGDLIQVYKELSPELRKRIHKVGGGKAPKDVVTVKQATELVRVTKDHKEQEELWGSMKKEDGRPHELLIKYKEAPEEIKEKVRKGDIDLKDVEEATIDVQIKQSNKEGHTEFIPNFETRLKDFGYNVAKLEQQVAIFRKVFASNNFYSKYKMLGNKEKKFLDNSIYDIRKRVKKCYDEVEFFISKIEDKKLLEDKK